MEKGNGRRLRERILARRNMLFFRMSVYFALGATLPLIAFAVAATVHTRNIIYEQANRFSVELAEEVSRNIQREINALQIISIDIAYSDAVQELSRNYDELTRSERQYAMTGARLDIARKLAFMREVTDVLLYLGDGHSLYLYGNFAIPFRLLQDYEAIVINDALELNGRMSLHAFNPAQMFPGLRLQQDLDNNTAECLMLSRAIRSLPEGDVLGILSLRMHARLFNDALRSVEAGDGVRFFAFDGMGTTMLTTDESLFTTGAPLPPEVVAQLESRNDGLFSLYHGGIDFLYHDVFIEDLGWTIVLLMPKENLDREITTIVLTFMLILGVALLLVVLSIHFFYRIFSKPLANLVDAMNSADSGNLYAEVDYTSEDEIGQAAHSFNNLLQRVRQLLDDVKAEETKKHTAELAALQAQINPHFISNTLGAAKILAQNQKAENIDQLLTALIELLNISMGVGGSLITLQEEVKYVQSYVRIMQFRNFTSTEVNYLIQDSVEDCLVPKMILQPLVENALIHGIAGSDQPLQIDVRAVADGDMLCLSVVDNGKGISQEAIESIMSAPPNEFGKRFSSIGLPNVHERVQRIFGDSYGLSIESKINLFTNIEITMPLVKDSDLSNDT